MGSIVGGDDRWLQEQFYELVAGPEILRQVDEFSLYEIPPPLATVEPYFVRLDRFDSFLVDDVAGLDTFSGECRFKTELEGLFIKVIFV